MAGQNRGGMDITEHKRTFEGFVRAIINAVVIVFLVLIFLALVNA
ncbi:MAG: aa3-type cytochrome c oxidase subunit IV [Alphaproteobacteria bacterium]|nr:MAG: aa3-type cytochrome c oxidase subunit IV [Alphaproteobacteria bacterium]